MERLSRIRCKVLVVSALFIITISIVVLARPSINSNSSLAVSDSWPMFRHDAQHTGYSSSSAPSTLLSKWNSTTYGSGAVTSSPSVVNGKVFVGSDDNNLYVIDENTGAKIWVRTTDSQVHSSPAVAGGRVFIGSNDQYIRAYNETNGFPLWPPVKLSGAVYSSAAVVNDKVLIASQSCWVYTLNASNGNILWAWQWDPAAYDPDNYYTDRDLYSSPASSDEIMYFGAYARWGHAQYYEDPYYYRTSVFALNTTNKSVKWEKIIASAGGFGVGQGPRIYSSPLVVGNMVFIGADDHYIYCLNANNGDLLWKFKTEGPVRSSPAVANGKVFFGSDDKQVYGFTQIGAKLWNFTTGGPVRSSPAIADGKIYVGSDDGYLYVLDEDTGTLLDKFDTGAAVESSPAVANGMVFVGSNNGDIMAFEAASEPSRLDVTTETFNVRDKAKSVFGWRGTVRVGANVTEGDYPIPAVKVTIRDPVGNILVNNASMTFVGGMDEYNYRYDYNLMKADWGTYAYTVYAKDTANNWAQDSGTFIVMKVSTTDDGPWSVTRGHHYNVSFTVRPYGSKARVLTLWVDVPNWHAVAFATVNGSRVPFRSIASPRSGYVRFAVKIGGLNRDAHVDVKLSILTVMSAETEAKMLYYHTTWWTVEGYYQWESLHKQTINVS